MVDWWFLTWFSIFFFLLFIVLFHFFFKWVAKEERELERAHREYLKIKEEIETQVPIKQGEG